MPIEIVCGPVEDVHIVRTTALGVAAVVNDAYTRAEIGLWNRSLERTNVEEVSERLRAGTVLTARTDAGEVVGAVFVSMCAPRRGWLGALAVQPACSGAGIGAALVSAAETHCRGLGAVEMQLEVLAPRPAHQHTDRLWRWYHSLGYAEHARQPLAQSEPTLAAECTRACDLVVLRRSLSPVLDRNGPADSRVTSDP